MPLGLHHNNIPLPRLLLAVDAARRIIQLRRHLDAGQPLDHALCLVDDAADAGGLGAHLVAVGVHDLDQLLAGVVRAVLVEGVVEVEEEDLEVVDFFGGLCVSGGGLGWLVVVVKKGRRGG